jgi:hypothetical protein
LPWAGVFRRVVVGVVVGVFWGWGLVRRTVRRAWRSCSNWVGGTGKVVVGSGEPSSSPAARLAGRKKSIMFLQRQWRGVAILPRVLR